MPKLWSLGRVSTLTIRLLARIGSPGSGNPYSQIQSAFTAVLLAKTGAPSMGILMN